MVCDTVFCGGCISCDWFDCDVGDMEKEIKKVRWTTGEVAEMLVESASKVRFWCKYFNVKPSRQGDKRRFNQAEIDVLRNIQKFIAEGYKQEFIKDKI